MNELIAFAEQMRDVPLPAALLAFGWRVWPDVTGAVGRICGPAADEIALVLRNQIRSYRMECFLMEIAIANQKLAEHQLGENTFCHPRILSHVCNYGSWVDDHEVQDWWGGLLASSCTEDGKDDSNLIFTNLLGQMTSLQARIVKYACENGEKVLMESGLINTTSTPGSGMYIGNYNIEMSFEECKKQFEESDIHRIDREVDYLRTLDLISGSATNYSKVHFGPTPLGLNLYVRCNGSRQTPVDFFGLGEVQQ